MNEETQKYFIHFNSSQDLKKFLKMNKLSVGHVCCAGKGAHLKGVNSYNEINDLKRKFYSLKNATYAPVNNDNEMFDCPVCFESMKISKRYKMNCTHNICLSCINSMKNRDNLQDNCPLCRVPFT